MKTLRPFWRYYGAKWQVAPRYPEPVYDTVIEPFAGAAGYSLRHYRRNVVLVDVFPIIAEVWRYLIATSAQEILAIPLVDHIDDLPASTPQAAKWLVGFTMNAGAVRPNRKISSGMLKFREEGRVTEGWCERMRDRAASQVDLIRHWKVIEGSYHASPDLEATWFIDPPYSGRPGSHYVHGSALIDYAELGAWCRDRRGQVIVCEAKGATWLPFSSIGDSTGVSGLRSGEAVWISDQRAQMEMAL